MSENYPHAVSPSQKVELQNTADIIFGSTGHTADTRPANTGHLLVPGMVPSSLIGDIVSEQERAATYLADSRERHFVEQCSANARNISLYDRFGPFEPLIDTSQLSVQKRSVEGFSDTNDKWRGMTVVVSQWALAGTVKIGPHGLTHRADPNARSLSVELGHRLFPGDPEEGSVRYVLRPYSDRVEIRHRRRQNMAAIEETPPWPFSELPKPPHTFMWLLMHTFTSPNTSSKLWDILAGPR